MTERSRASFDEVQRTLTIQMVATPRCELVTCSPGESVADAYGKANGAFDHLPVAENGLIVGFFEVQLPTSLSGSNTITRHMVPKSENHLIAADTKISEYLLQDWAPRLVVPCLDLQAPVQGLVTPADTRRPAAQAALACLIIELEVALVHRIEEKWPGPNEAWMQRLEEPEQGSIRKWHCKAQGENRDVGLLLETSLRHKMKILGVSEDDAKLIARLRNDVFHVKEAAQPPEPSMTSEVMFRSVRELGSKGV